MQWLCSETLMQVWGGLAPHAGGQVVAGARQPILNRSSRLLGSLTALWCRLGLGSGSVSKYSLNPLCQEIREGLSPEQTLVKSKTLWEKPLVFKHMLRSPPC